MTRSMRACLMLPAMFALVSCDDFGGAKVPIVEQGKGAQPIAEGEYQLFLENSTQPIMTGIQLVRVEDHYEARFLSHCRLTLSRDVIPQATLAEATNEIDKITSMPDVEIAEQLASVLGLLEYFAPLGTPGTPDSREQREFLARYPGFVMGNLENDYYLHQVPLTFPVSSWPATKSSPNPRWSFKVVKVEGGSLRFYDSASASLSASKALFGTTRSCDNEGKCTDSAKVGSFTDMPELNRQIVVRAVREFSGELKLLSRLERVQPSR